MYILIEYRSSYSETTGSLWFYSKNEATNFAPNIANNNNLESSEYKAKSVGNTEATGTNKMLKNATIAVPLKYLSNFWISLQMSLINCKIVLKLKWTKYCVLSTVGADKDNVNTNNIIFIIKDTKL